jgi:hypothetical protein
LSGFLVFLFCGGVGVGCLVFFGCVGVVFCVVCVGGVVCGELFFCLVFLVGACLGCGFGVGVCGGFFFFLVVFEVIFFVGLGRKFLLCWVLEGVVF